MSRKARLQQTKKESNLGPIPYLEPSLSLVFLFLFLANFVIVLAQSLDSSSSFVEFECFYTSKLEKKTKFKFQVFTLKLLVSS
jgi:hypothetical protein